MKLMNNIIKINLKNFNIYTVLSLLSLLAGLLLWFYWIARYGVVYDIGIYSLVVVLVLPGIIGLILSLIERPQEEN